MTGGGKMISTLRFRFPIHRRFQRIQHTHTQRTLNVRWVFADNINGEKCYTKLYSERRSVYSLQYNNIMEHVSAGLRSVEYDTFRVFLFSYIFPFIPFIDRVRAHSSLVLATIFCRL